MARPSSCTGCGARYALQDGEDYFCSKCHANMDRLEHLTKTFEEIGKEFLSLGYDKVEVKEAMVKSAHLL